MNRKKSPSNHQEIAEVLLSNPLVEDCYLLNRGDQLIAYIVYSGIWNPQELASDLRSKLPENSLPNIYIPISGLPLTDAGNVDEKELKKIEIVNDNLIENTTQKLQSLAEIEQVTVIITPPENQNLSLHLSELLPFRDREKVSEKNLEIEAKITLEVSPSTTQLAISHGNPLIESEHQPKTLGDVLQKTAYQNQNKGIVYIQSQGLPIFQSYQKLWEEAQKIHTGLKKIGLQTQDKVIFQLSENSDIIPAFWGCILGGFIPGIISVPKTYKDLNNEIQKICQVWELLDHPLIITSETLYPQVKTLERWLSNASLKLTCIEELNTHSPQQTYESSSPDDIAFFNLTSGSTGMSKCISLTHKNLLSRARGANLLCDYNDEDIILNWLPFDHIGSISELHIRCVDLGCQMIYVQTEYILGHPLNWLELINQYRVTHSWAPNFAYNLINEALKKEASKDWNLDCIKFFLVAGEAVSDKSVGDFINKLHTEYNLKKNAVRPAFGMAEMGSGITYYQPTPQHPLLFHTVDKSSLNQTLKRVHPEHPNASTFADLGLPIPSISIRIVDQDNVLLPEDTIGHLQVKGDPVSPGYYKNSEANQQAFLKDGWFKTGDLGFISNGHLVITGRSKETIIINGVNYYSHEIEAAAETIEEVEASYTAACAVHDADSNTDHLALFFSAETLDKRHLRDLLKTIRQKIINTFGISPEYLIPLTKTEIPKTSIGKIQRSQLVKRFEAGEFNSILKTVDILLENHNTIPDWFYRQIWQPRLPIYLKSELSKNYTLIFLDHLGLGECVSEQLTAKNSRCIVVLAGENFAQLSRDRYIINPENQKDYTLLMKFLAEKNIIINNIIHLWTYQEYQGEITSIEQLEKTQNQGIYSLLFLVQALVKTQDNKHSIDLLFVSSYSQKVRENDEIAYEKSPVLGLLKTLPKEIPWLKTRHIDIPVDNNNINGAYLLQELHVLSTEREIAYRKGQRFISGLEKVNFTRQNQQEIPFKQGGIYLITGGLGGIGFLMAQYLLKNYQARLLLIGKTPLSEKNNPQKIDQSSLKLENLHTLENLGGEVIYQALDLANLTQLRQTLESIKNKWQGELDGIIHLAGIYQERLILEETKQTLSTTLHPKVLGTYALSQILKDSPALFISFSSLASFFGGASISAYAAANSFLEHFNEYQTSKNLFPSYCYSWSSWQDTGMSKDSQMQDLIRAQGYYTLTEQQGLDSLLAGLYHNQAQLIIGVDGNNPKIKRFTTLSEAMQKLTAFYTLKNPLHPINLSHLDLKDSFGTPYQCQFYPRKSLPLKDTGEIDTEQLINQLRGQENRQCIAPRNETEQTIANIWQSVLNVSRIGIHDNFFALGGHSLLASQVISRLRDVFSVELSLQSLLEYPTIANLSQTLEVLNRVQNRQNIVTETSEEYEVGEL